MLHIKEIVKIQFQTSKTDLRLGKLGFTKIYHTLNDCSLNGSVLWTDLYPTGSALMLNWYISLSFFCVFSHFRHLIIKWLLNLNLLQNVYSLWFWWWQMYLLMGQWSWMTAYQCYTETAFLGETLPGIERFSKKMQSSSGCQPNIYGIPLKINCFRQCKPIPSPSFMPLYDLTLWNLNWEHTCFALYINFPRL